MLSRKYVRYIAGIVAVFVVIGVVDYVRLQWPTWRQAYRIRQDMKEAERQEAIRARSEVPGYWIAAVDSSPDITDGKKTVTAGYIRRELWFGTDKIKASVFATYRTYFPGLNDGWKLGRADAAAGTLFFYNDAKGQQLSITIAPRSGAIPGSTVYINWLTVKDPAERQFLTPSPR